MKKLISLPSPKKSLIIIGNPTNIYIATSFGIDFVEYFMKMAIPTIVTGLTTLLLMLIVFYLYEIKKSFSFLLPITLSCVLFLSLIGKCPIYMLFWMFIPIIFILMIPVLIGALLSIIAMYVTRFLKKVPILQALLCVAIFAFVIYGVVYLIKLIPTNIDLINQWPTVSKAIRNFLLFIEEKLPFMAQLVSILIGDITVSLVYSLNIMSFVKLLILHLTENHAKAQ